MYQRVGGTDWGHQYINGNPIMYWGKSVTGPTSLKHFVIQSFQEHKFQCIKKREQSGLAH